MYKALILDGYALNYLQRAHDLTPDWLKTFLVSPDTKQLRLRSNSGFAFLLSDRASAESRLVVLKGGSDGLFADLPEETRIEAFDRATKAALSCFEATVVIPLSWKPYHYAGLISFHSSHWANKSGVRLVIDKAARGTRHAYVFTMPIETKLQEFKPDYSVFDAAIRAYPVALKLQADQRHLDDAAIAACRLDLDDVLPEGFTHGLSVAEWYKTKLTKVQRAFVDFPMDRSVRIRGPAGTGKTLSLVVKCLRELYDRIDTNVPYNIAFLTHSTATVDLVRSMLNAIDQRGILYDARVSDRLQVLTLQELANVAVGYNLADLTPLSSDGLEGRTLQLEIIQSLVKQYQNSDWITRAKRCSPPFVELMESVVASPKGRFFAWELMNEFACVLDADGVRSSAQRARDYLSARREPWMMPLETRDEREAVLDLYREFGKQLRDMNTIGTDQMITDYLSYLDSFKWDGLRAKAGYDAVFVDELQLFNRQERMIFHSLMRDASKPPVVLMAYDAKQSTRDNFIGATQKESEKLSFERTAGLGAIQTFDVQDVFRYTPQIAKALLYIDQSFPAAGFGDEWPVYGGKSQIEGGPLPVAVEMSDERELYNLVFERAGGVAKRLGQGRKVAVLCCGRSSFETYLKAGQHKGLFVPITSRDQLSNLAHAGKRFIYSRPEYVAGLQFECVFLIDVNEEEVPEGPHATGARRRFVSEVYLGASRTQRRLEIFARRDAGGISRILQIAIGADAIKIAQGKDLEARPE